MGLEEFKTGNESSVSKDDLVLDGNRTVQATLDGQVTDAQYKLSHFAK